MKTIQSHVRVIAHGAVIAGVVSFATDATAQTVVNLLPNLKPLPATNFSLVTDSAGDLTLRFSTTSWNNGAGPLILVAGSVDRNRNGGEQQVLQRYLLSSGSYVDHLAGWFTWHEGHNHFHFDGYALYTLQPVNAPGGSLRTGSKTTFCVMDTTMVNGNLQGAPAQAVYSTCGAQIQGMSVGWGDTYGSHLAGQEIDFTDNADGMYQLKIEIDPNKLLLESNENDNVSCVLLNIQKPSTITVLDSSGSCSTVTSITPKSAVMNTTVPVTITGFGFSEGMSVSFEGGNGPRPTASNVQVAPDGRSVTATVTVPYKKQPGKDPVWDVRAGTGGVLRNAFRVCSDPSCAR